MMKDKKDLSRQVLPKDPRVGKTIWVIPEGFIPRPGKLTQHEFLSHETLCILNANKEEAHISITLYFSDQNPIGPYVLTVPAQRTHHVRFNDLTDPGPIPLEKDFSSVIRSNQPIVVQHTRLDSRHPDLTLMTTMAYPVEES